MGSAATSSKPKKNSGEDRRKRKKPKSRKRRRVSSSPSPYSSDSDDAPRLRRSSRRKHEKRRGRDPKRSTKKKHRKVHHSVSLVSMDSGDFSDRSRSPVRHRDRKGKKSKRGRKLDGAVGASKSRNRSLSCSTCSGRDSRSNSPRRIHGYRGDKSKEMDSSRLIKSSSLIESRGDVEEMHGGGDRVIDNELNEANYDDLRQENSGHYMERVEQDLMMDTDSYGQAVEIDRWMSGSSLENDSYFHQLEDSGKQTSDFCKQMDFNSDLSRRIKSQIVVAAKHDSESDDLELMLRQKALENLNKLRGGLSSDNKATCEENVSTGYESSEKPCETVQNIISPPESDSITSKQRHIQVGVPSHESNLNPVNKLQPVPPNHSISEKKLLFSRLSESRNSKQLENSPSSQHTLNQPNIIENSTKKISFRQSPCRGSPEKNATDGCESGNSLRAELSLGDGLVSGNTLPIEKEKILETNETMKEYQSGSQFEKKTFSRMHDGEMVQVSYKVYIPNKTPALARRKLQR